MLDRINKAERPLLIGCALAAFALTGWGSFTYSTISSGRQVSVVTAERDKALTELHQLQQAAAELNRVEAKLTSARMEYSRTVEGWAQVKERLAAAQKEYAALSKRLDQTRERVAHTSSTPSPEPPKKAAKPAR